MVKPHEKLGKYLSEHGITQTFVADKTNISVKTLNGILKGRQRLSADMLHLICKKALSVNPSIFFED